MKQVHTFRPMVIRRLYSSGSRPNHLVSLVNERISLNGPQEKVFVVALGFADGIGMGGKVAHRVDEPVAVLAHISKVRRVPVTLLQVFQQAQIVLLLGVGHLLTYREEGLHQVQNLPVGQLDLGQFVHTPAQLAHIELGQAQGFTGFPDAAHDVLGVPGCPNPIGAVQGQIQGVLTDHPDRGHGNLHAAAAVVGVHDHQVGRDLISRDDVPLGHPGQHPYLSAHLERTGGLIGDAFAQQFIGELEGVLILNHLVAVGHNAQHPAVGAADVGLVACNPAAVLGLDILLQDLPVQARPDQRVGGSRGFGHHGTQTVPGFLADIKHGFNIGRHCSFLLVNQRQ